MADVRRIHGHLIFGDGPERWSAPDPTAQVFEDGRHRARYPLPGEKPNYQVAELADIYAYLVAGCPTTKLAIEKLRAIRKAIREDDDGGTDV